MYIFLDTETTGTGSDDRLCQIAFKNEDGLVVDELFNPGMPISLEAMAVHHITNEMVADKPPFKGSPACEKLKALLGDEKGILVAHNAKFDLDMLRKEAIQAERAICTYKLSRHLDQEGSIPQYNLQYLRYYLKLDIDAVPHSALGDILVLEGLFHRIHARFMSTGEAEAVAQMLKISNGPVLIARMPFGKHKGQKMAQVPTSYLNWLLGTDIDDDLAYTARYYLGEK
ncbi:MAG: DUF3820 family protein [Deltaproteobacteria bacterium]|nr:DUF3820 family protein [Deltaproteobacteria bacterium]MBW2676554.1 DUF3820 family protein [Deltaproteobacteria bacterium]